MSRIRTPGVLRGRWMLIPDVDGRESRLFGGFTAGQTFVYDVQGRLRFAGGITDARGHEGGNFGSDAVRCWRSSP